MRHDGANHVYLTTAASPAVHDLGPPQAKLAGEQAVGLAYDQRGDRLLILSAAGDRAQIGALTAGSSVTYYVTLAAAISTVSLGYDSDAQHYFVPLANGHDLGEFDAAGNLVAPHPAGDHPITAVDAGPRSLVRVF